MTRSLGAKLTSESKFVNAIQIWGRVSAIHGGIIRVSGLQDFACIGDLVVIKSNFDVPGEVIAIDQDDVIVIPECAVAGLSPGERVYFARRFLPRPTIEWLGHIISPNGTLVGGAPAPVGETEMPLNALPPVSTERRGLGPRLNSGLSVFDTFLPICRGQRIGIFAGSGVGKSSLLAQLANNVEADVVIVALIGERSREVREFANDILGAKDSTRKIIVASDCSESATSKRRGALLAIATAEYFRDLGLHVLLIFDSITRFADAHREIALTSGETPSLRAYPPSTFGAIAALAERTGPGSHKSGDITAIFSVLVAGSDMEEPIADMTRSILDGHIVLDRGIAERGRFPAIDIRRSVSRSLPKAANDTENILIPRARNYLGIYEDAHTNIQTGLYTAGSDKNIDEAIEINPKLDAFASTLSDCCANSFVQLENALQIDMQNLETGQK
ncbi:MAG: FliI/YscN family ATPase [Marinicaulis sp.]|nr:FliI/YscN family ATPase [Marinicaulis sp.]